MNKFLFTCIIAMIVTSSLNAQQRIALSELFTGENCVPCSIADPNIWHLYNTPPNPTKLIDISYMEPIPTTGWFYMQTAALSNARLSYYSLSNAPKIRLDGRTAASGFIDQHDIDSEYTIPSHFNLGVTTSWNSTYDSVIATVTITCPTTAFTGISMYLRAALASSYDFTATPGANGQHYFQHVVRAMYPDASGTSIASSWPVGSTQTLTVTGVFPYSLADPSNSHIVVWIQDDFNQSVEQAAQAPLPSVPNNASISITNGPRLVCHDNTAYSFTHNALLKNEGNNTLTSATIFYSVDGGAYLSYTWTGSLAPGSNTSIAMPSSSAVFGGIRNHIIWDSIGMLNGVPAPSKYNKVSKYLFYIENTVPLSMPWSTSFENTDYGLFVFEDTNMNYQAWNTWYNTTAPYLGHTGTHAAGFYCFNYIDSEREIMTLPIVTTTNHSSMSFWEAYAQNDVTSFDKLEVIYSADCGFTWTPLWSASGATLASVSSYSTNPFIPISSQYAQKTLSLNTVPPGSIIAFRGTCGLNISSQNIWVDDVNITASTGLEQIDESSLNINVYPNPADEEATLAINLAVESQLQIQLTDVVGRKVREIADEKIKGGMYTFPINTSGLTAGIYNIVIHTDGGTFTRRLSVIK